MKNKENIFEELNKMKNLIHAKAGTVISEQAADVSGDVGRVMRQLNAANTNETDVVNTLKKYKTKQEFQNFVSQYEKIVGKKFGAALRTALSPGTDPTEWNDLKSHLSTMGITLSSMYNAGDDNTTFQGLSTAAAPATATAEEIAKGDEAFKTTYSCVPSQPGATATKMSNGSTVYKIGEVYYYSNGRKKLANGTMSNYNCSTEFKSNTPRQSTNTGSSVNNRFADSVKSLGVEGGKMDLQTLQTILKSLEGETTTAAAPTQGTPDLAQLTAALNQLNA